MTDGPAPAGPSRLRPAVSAATSWLCSPQGTCDRRASSRAQLDDLEELRQTVLVPSQRKVKPEPAVQRAAASLDRWEQWIEELEDHPLDFFEYEALLLHREGLDDELEVVGDDEMFSRADELDSRFDLLTVEVSDSPFARGSEVGSVDDRERKGGWRVRLPASAESREYRLLR